MERIRDMEEADFEQKNEKPESVTEEKSVEIELSTKESDDKPVETTEKITETNAN